MTQSNVMMYQHTMLGQPKFYGKTFIYMKQCIQVFILSKWAKGNRPNNLDLAYVTPHFHDATGYQVYVIVIDYDEIQFSSN